MAVPRSAVAIDRQGGMRAARGTPRVALPPLPVPFRRPARARGPAPARAGFGKRKAALDEGAKAAGGRKQGKSFAGKDDLVKKQREEDSGKSWQELAMRGDTGGIKDMFDKAKAGKEEEEEEEAAAAEGSG